MSDAVHEIACSGFFLYMSDSPAQCILLYNVFRSPSGRSIRLELWFFYASLDVSHRASLPGIGKLIMTSSSLILQSVYNGFRVLF